MLNSMCGKSSINLEYFCTSTALCNKITSAEYLYVQMQTNVHKFIVHTCILGEVDNTLIKELAISLGWRTYVHIYI